MAEYVVEMRDIVKDFPGLRANDHITLQLKKGEVHALLGGKRRGQKHAHEHPVRAVPGG